jgi:hypothetical protein
MTLLSTHRNHSYKYKYSPKSFRQATVKRMSKHLLNKTQKPKEDMLSYDLYAGGSVYTVMIPKNIDLYTGLKLWYPGMLHAIIYNIAPSAADAVTTDDFMNHLDYDEWIRD